MIKSINGTSSPIKISHKYSCRFSKVSKVAILKIAKMAFFKFLTSALAFSLGLDFLEFLFLFWPTTYVQCNVLCYFCFLCIKQYVDRGHRKKIHVSLAFVWPLFYASLVLVFLNHTCRSCCDRAFITRKKRFWSFFFS